MTTYFTIQEAADELRVDYKVVYRMVRQGRMPATRVGWQFRISREDLMAYLNSERVVQASVAQSIRGDQTMQARPQSDAHLPQPVADSSSKVVSKLQARQLEIAFINRFHEKVKEIVTLRHPISGERLNLHVLQVAEEEGDEQEVLMEALNTAFLSASVLSTTPLNQSLRFTIPGKVELVLEARVRTHLATFATIGTDDKPVSIEEVMLVLHELAEAAVDNTLYVVGLGSPTGWAKEAVRYISGGERGDTFRSASIKLVLVDLRTGAVYQDRNDSTAVGFSALFELSTESEQVASLQALLQTELDTRLDRGVILREYSAELGVKEALLQRAATNLARSSDFRLIEDSRYGMILVTTQ